MLHPSQPSSQLPFIRQFYDSAKAPHVPVPCIHNADMAYGVRLADHCHIHINNIRHRRSRSAYLRASVSFYRFTHFVDSAFAAPRPRPEVDSDHCHSNKQRANRETQSWSPRFHDLPYALRIRLVRRPRPSRWAPVDRRRGLEYCDVCNRLLVARTAVLTNDGHGLRIRLYDAWPEQGGGRRLIGYALCSSRSVSKNVPASIRKGTVT